MSDDQVFAYREGGKVEVERAIDVWGVFDHAGREDDEHGTWRKRTVDEFARAILEAAVGLTDTWVEVRDNHGSGVVNVCGTRDATAAEKADLEQREWRMWVAAKGTYERGRERFGDRP